MPGAAAACSKLVTRLMEHVAQLHSVLSVLLHFNGRFLVDGARLHTSVLIKACRSGHLQPGMPVSVGAPLACR